MALRYVLDEHLRGPLWNALSRHNARGALLVDVVRVGDMPELPLSIADSDLLVWAEDQHRILVTADKRTMPLHLDAHVRAGRTSPGVFLLRPRRSLPQIVDFLVLAAHASEPREWRDRIVFIPPEDAP